MTASDGDVTTAQIRCDVCGDTTAINAVEKAVTMGTVATFFAAHRDCGEVSRFHLDLRASETASPQAVASLPSPRPPDPRLHPQA